MYKLPKVKTDIFSRNLIQIPKNAKFDKKQLAIGIDIELEHTTSRKRAEHIAKQHLMEFPNYYTALVKMERHLSR